jgi:hypothetical protein
VGRIKVIGKRKAVKRLEPAMVGIATFRRFAHSQHGEIPLSSRPDFKDPHIEKGANGLPPSFNIFQLT